MDANLRTIRPLKKQERIRPEKETKGQISNEKGGPDNSKAVVPYQKPKEAPKVDPSRLKVVNITVGDSRLKGVVGTVVSFDILGRQEYVKWQMCSVTSLSQKDPVCKEGITIQNRILLPFLYSGPNRVEITACSDENNVLPGVTEMCGPTSPPVTFDTGRSDRKILTVYNRLDLTIDQLVEIDLEKYTHFNTYESRTSECAEQNSAFDKKRRESMAIVEAYLRLPSNIFSFVVRQGYYKLIDSNTVTGVLSEGATIAAKEIGGVIKNSCSQYQYWDSTVTKGAEMGYKTWLCPMAGNMLEFGKQMVFGQSPLTPLIMMWNNINDLITPESSVPKACSETMLFMRITNELDKKRKELSERLFSIKSDLICLGEIETGGSSPPQNCR